MNRPIAFAVAAFLILILAWSSLFEVDQPEVALLLRFGAVRETVTDPGLHFKVPFIDEVVTFDSRLLDSEPPAEEVILGDQKRIVVDTYTLFRISDPLLFYQTAHGELAARTRIEEIVNSAVRQVLGNYPITDVLSPKREMIMHEILTQVSQQAKPLGVIVADVRLRHADLPAGTSQSIYARMKSERQREAAQARGEGQMQSLQIRAGADRQRTVILAEAQRQAQILRGQGDAQATGIYAQAYGQDPKFYDFYRSLQAYRTALAGGNTSYVLTLQSDFFKFLGSAPAGVGATVGSTNASPANASPANASLPPP